MPAASSIVPSVIDYLFNTFTASATLGAAPDPGTVTVFDGPATSEASVKLALWVGLDDPDGTGGAKAADSASVWAGLGAQHRKESVSILCVADAWTGADDIRTARQLAYGITAAVETIINADGTLGGLISTGYNPAAVTSMTLTQNNTEDGALARVTFTITSTARR